MNKRITDGYVLFFSHFKEIFDEKLLVEVIK